MSQQDLSDFTDWKGMYNSHPQSRLLINHVERATHDIFFDSLNNESSDLLYLLDSEEQLDNFLEKMLSYWKKKEEFEKCAMIIKRGNILKDRLKKKDIPNMTAMERLNNWIKTTF